MSLNKEELTQLKSLIGQELIEAHDTDDSVVLVFSKSKIIISAAPIGDSNSYVYLTVETK